MAGVQITQPNGTPGAGFEVKVRGVGTVTAGSSPLYVIDGVPLSDDTGDATGITVSPLASIETSDIESIEVLKDASAAAIYGSRGSNGVVIITTKQGKEGKPVVERRILPEDVKDFEECFVTNSLMGIMPVTALGEVEFQSRKVTESWMAKYEDFVYKAAYK